MEGSEVETGERGIVIALLRGELPPSLVDRCDSLLRTAQALVDPAVEPQEPDELEILPVRHESLSHLREDLFGLCQARDIHKVRTEIEQKAAVEPRLRAFVDPGLRGAEGFEGPF